MKSRYLPDIWVIAISNSWIKLTLKKKKSALSLQQMVLEMLDIHLQKKKDQTERKGEGGRNEEKKEGKKL